MIDHLDVTVRGEQRRIDLQPDDAGQKLTRILRQQGLALNTRCGGKGICDGCLIDIATADGQTQRMRACELTPQTLAKAGYEARFTIPGRSLLAHEPQVVSNFKVRVPWANNPLWQGERAGVDKPLGCAIDIGTTTVALMLVELATGRVKARVSMFNKQMRYGDDVLTRINLCSSDERMLGKLQAAVARHTITPLIEQACEKAQASVEQIVCHTVAANTTMLHLFAGVDPTSLGLAPFTAPFLEHRQMHTSDVGLPGDAEVHLLPGAAAYVGADLVAGCLATGQAYNDKPTLLVDVGTNGEIILHHGEHLYGCATAAGPAFEGARLSSGMRAADGAVEHIRLTADDETFKLAIQTIGQADPVGVCGSAYLDFLAEGRRSGLLNVAGRFVLEHEAIGSAGTHGKRLRLHGNGDASEAVSISESDVASLLQAKGAIGAGIITLMDKVGLAPADIDQVYLAGGFGMHLDVASACGAGLLPGFEPEQVEAVGNTSLAGAFMALLDQAILDELKRIGEEIEVIELNLEPMFEMTYIEQLSLP